MARVGAVTHDDNASHSFAIAIQLGNPAPHLGPKLHVCDLIE
jgi:hypothetical protein